MTNTDAESTFLALPSFNGGMDQWSIRNGIGGDGGPAQRQGARLVLTDEDLGACLEMPFGMADHKIRCQRETPLRPQRYLKVSVRVRLICGGAVDVCIGGWAGGAQGVPIKDVLTRGPMRRLCDADGTVEVSAIVGPGARSGVDLSWGPEALFGLFGLDLCGAADGVIRISDFTIKDVTTRFVDQSMRWVDPIDFGAKGDGSGDDTAAFVAADQFASRAGQKLLVSKGIYSLRQNLTLFSRVSFDGLIQMPVDCHLVLENSFDLRSYASAFGGVADGLSRGLQALSYMSGPAVFDLNGMVAGTDKPLLLTPRAEVGISNGTIRATGAIEPTACYLLDLHSATDLERFRFRNVTLDCGGVMRGLRLPDQSCTIEIRDCDIRDVSERAVASDGMAQVRLDGCSFSANKSSKGAVGLALQSPPDLTRCSFEGFEQSLVLSAPTLALRQLN